MFTVHCPKHRAEVLIWPAGIEAVRNVEGEIHVDFHCACGWAATLVTGRGAGKRVVARLAAAPEPAPDRALIGPLAG